MSRYLVTHSLLSAWLYALKGSPYENTERDPFAEFLTVLRREPTPTTEAMQNGRDFEDLVTAFVYGGNVPRGFEMWRDAAQKIADIVRGGVLQCKASKTLEAAGIAFVLYGRLDALKAGAVYDIKFSQNYERGKYFTSTQHPVYLELIPRADKFTYLVSNGSSVWTETYRRDETADIRKTIAEFVEWLKMNELFETYQNFWRAK